MNDYSSKSPSELLTLLVDGELHDPEATSLFSNLSENDELRGEFQELLKIRESVRNDTEAFTPPIEATKGIFEKLGIIHPAAYVAQTASVATKWSSASLRWGIPVVAAIIASLFTAALLINHYENVLAEKDTLLANNIPTISSFSFDNNPAQSDEKSISNNTISVNELQLKENNTSRLVKSNRKSNESVNNVLTEDAIEDIPQNQDESEVVHRPSTTTLVHNAKLNIESNVDKSFLYSENNIRLNNLNSAIIEEQVFVLGNSQNEIMLSIGGNFGQKIGGSSSANNLSSGFSIGLFPLKSSNLQIGFIYGREPFGIEVLNESNGLYENDPSQPVSWAGVAGRYEFIEAEVFNSLYPYGMFVIGATEYGMLSKACAGMQFDLTGGIAASCALEYSLLRYSNQLQTHLYNKLGITGNLVFRF